ncbi:hypothetical protein Q6308_28200, partial [Klebsiella pneumoniae]|uniref:hypothetical protein n=1 Tax=Klebsiella pneumoniae TaxID=573 RepID=UPI00273165DD
ISHRLAGERYAVILCHKAGQQEALSGLKVAVVLRFINLALSKRSKRRNRRMRAQRTLWISFSGQPARRQ